MKQLVTASFITASFILGFLGCSKDAGIPGQSLRLNKKLEAGGGTFVTMDSVLSDSRCPKGAQCIWEGNAAVRFVLESGDILIRVVLNTAISPKDTVVYGYEVKLISISPEPGVGKTISQSDYSAQVIVNKK